MTFSGFSNGVCKASNFNVANDYTNNGQITANGQLLIGATAAPNVRVGTITSTDGSVTVTNGPGTIDLSTMASSGFNSVKQIIIENSGTYTPSPNMTYCMVELVSGGGGGGGAPATAGGQAAAGGGGGGGSYSRSFFTAAQIGASQSVTIGDGGNGGVGGNPGANGGTTSFGSLFSVPGSGGGEGGVVTGGSNGPQVKAGGPTSFGNGQFNIRGSSGGTGYAVLPTRVFGGYGGSSFYSGSTKWQITTTPESGLSYGGGGAGAGINAHTASTQGASGHKGVCVITEYIGNSSSGSGAILQQVRNFNSTFISSTTPMPVDDTIPQIGEGTEIVSVSITRLSPTSILEIDFSCFAHYNSSTDSAAIAIFVSGQNDAIDAVCLNADVSTNGGILPCCIRTYLSTTANSTFTISARGGSSSGTDFTINGGAARLFGGSAKATLTVTEYAS